MQQGAFAQSGSTVTGETSVAIDISECSITTDYSGNILLHEVRPESPATKLVLVESQLRHSLSRH
jgi:hypothetical protein